MITIADRTLSRIVSQTKPHMGDRNDSEAVQVITFEFADGHLYTWATNRYTLAVARTQAKGDDKPWLAVMGRQQMPELAAAIRLLDAKPISMERNGDHLILSGESGSRITIELQDDRQLLDWRKVVAAAAERPSAAKPMALDPKFFAAWKSLPGPVQMWSSGEQKAGVIIAADFIGLQMPINPSPEAANSLRRELDSWKPAEPASLAAAA
ncbi:hypothetical protein [Streptomyces sp. OR43]|uniref:hypothetical protein n=1 Tax=Streptomyces sp. or43 TaxID=2478957 RepID=UPI0011CE79E6|nr:hypothetical protein [Streptomyces sp. or43]TXS48905.1 hypothetical protein EAO72_02825 [Streptomyces sp. or43]